MPPARVELAADRLEDGGLSARRGRVAVSRAHVRSRTGSSRVRGGCSAYRAAWARLRLRPSEQTGAGFSLEGKMPTQARPHRGAGGWSRTNDFVRVGSLRADEDGCPCLDSNQILPGKSRMLVLSSFKGRIARVMKSLVFPLSVGCVFRTQLV